KGTNALIQKGATLVTGVADILNELNISMVTEYVTVETASPENDMEKAVLAQLSHEPVLTDDLVNKLGLPTEVVTGTLAIMELKGMVRQATGTSYILAREERAPYA
ncbi:MAG TPA: DNA-protecting protein DprA, partial [Anaerolineae bacterium]